MRFRIKRLLESGSLKPSHRRILYDFERHEYVLLTLVFYGVKTVVKSIQHATVAEHISIHHFWNFRQKIFSLGRHRPLTKNLYAILFFQKVENCRSHLTMRFRLHLTIPPQFAIECLRRSNQQGVGHVVPKFGRKGLSDVSQILTRSGRHASTSVVCKKILVDIFSHLSTMHERNGQTNTKTNQQIDRSRNRKIDDNRPRRNRLPLPAMSPINGSMIREWCNAI